MAIKMNGYIPEPFSDKHWVFEDKLKPRLEARTDDVDLREFSSPPQNQRRTSSCVGHAVIKALELKRIMKYGHDAHVELSIMAIYYLARELQFPQQTGEDSGTYISLACDVLRRWGVCPDADWPFVIENINQTPPWLAMCKAYQHKIEAFYRIKSSGNDRVENIIQCLNAGNPVVFGTATGKNWNKYRTGDVLSKPDDTTGRHATVLVGYQDGKFIGENSWGQNWGDNGFYLMDKDYIKWGETRDIWTITAPWEEIK